MNKFAKALCMMAVVALAFTSCKKTETDVQKITFKGNIEQFRTIDSDLNRVYMDGENQVYFEDGDHVMVFNLYNEADEPTNYQSSASTYTVVGNDWLYPTGTLPYVINHGGPDAYGSKYYAFYPAERISDFTQLNYENRVTFTFGAEQTYRTVNGLPTVSNGDLLLAGKDENHDYLNEAWFNMRNIMGVLSLKLYSPSGRTVTSIVVEDKTFHLNGEVTLKLHETNPEELSDWFNNFSFDEAWQELFAEYLDGIGYDSNPGTKTVTLNCPDGVALGATAEDANRFFIVLRPLALLQGCTITVNFEDGGSFEIDTERNLVISPAVIRNIAPQNVG